MSTGRFAPCEDPKHSPSVGFMPSLHPGFCSSFCAFLTIQKQRVASYKPTGKESEKASWVLQILGRRLAGAKAPIFQHPPLLPVHDASQGVSKVSQTHSLVSGEATEQVHLCWVKAEVPPFIAVRSQQPPDCRVQLLGNMLEQCIRVL